MLPSYQELNISESIFGLLSVSISLERLEELSIYDDWKKHLYFLSVILYSVQQHSKEGH